MADKRTIGEAFRWASSFLQTQLASLQRLPEEERQAAAQHEAETLLCHRLRLSRTQLLTNMDKPISDEEWAPIASDLALRQSGVPLQYITGEAPFWGRLFQVRPGCLVPRPETEVLVEAAIHWLRSASLTRPSVLDVGTGSGAIAITVALEEPASDVHAIELSPAALGIARANAGSLGAAVTFHEGDAFTVMSAWDHPSVNLLLSNPPYIPSCEIQALDVEVRRHEPLAALDGGEDGLDFYRQLVHHAPSWFKPGRAAILLEVGAGQANDVAALFEAASAWRDFTFSILSDLRGIGRVVQGVRE